MENSDFFIEKNHQIPQIFFKSDGTFKIEGKMLPDNPLNVFNPIFNWLKSINIQNVNMDINLEYINTCASLQLFNLLRMLDENTSIKELKVRWFYEEGDEDHLETGQLYSEQLRRIKFEFIEVKENSLP